MSEETIGLLSVQHHDEEGSDIESLGQSNNDGNAIDTTDTCKDSTRLIEEDEDEKETKSPMSLVQKLSFLGIALTFAASAMTMSVIAPFFPYVAEKKDVTVTETGLVFGIYSFICFLASPVFGKYLPVIGGKCMFLSGSFLTGGCSILFGFVDNIGGRTNFLAYCFVIRGVEALGSAATLTAGLAIIANVFPDDVAKTASMLEIFMGLGLCLGPPIGSLFYAIGGYKLPFILLGCIELAVCTANIFIIPSLSSSKEEDHEAGSLMSVLKIPAVWVVIICAMMSYASKGLIDVSLAVHLTDPPFRVKPYMVGVLFLVHGGIYAIFAPVCGYIADIKKCTRIMIALGELFSVLSFFLIGPSPFLHQPGKLWVIIFSLFLSGCAGALSMSQIFLDMLISAEWYGLPNNLATQSVISGLFNMALEFGSCVGPIAGGALVNQFGFEWSATYLAVGGLCIFACVSLFSLWEFQCGKGRRKPSHVKEIS